MAAERRGPAGWTYGERLFQAARFVTEMEYQHLVFEEFVRKVQPAIDPFHVYHTDINPAIPAEFAHAVYRFGHSMLTETIDRGTEQPTRRRRRSVRHQAARRVPQPAGVQPATRTGPISSEAGSRRRSSWACPTRSGKEIDEFVTDTLRNNLLGLPLDLPTLNMTRARSRASRRSTTCAARSSRVTNDGQLAPYTSWADFGHNLKHPESLVNFVAAYGTHPTIVSATDLAAKRAAAQGDRRPRRRPTQPRAPTQHGLHQRQRRLGPTPTADHDRSRRRRPVGRRPRRDRPTSFGGLLGSDVQLRLRELRWPTCRTVTGSTTWPARPA